MAARNAVPIYERIAREIFKGKSPTPFRIPPGMRLVKWPYENGTIDEVFEAYEKDRAK